MAKKDNFFSEYTATNDVLDIDFLKERGISFVQEMSGNKWTDFNLHDPGLTILEIICLAINELGYRSDHEIHELIRVDTEKIDSFVESSDITTISPYTNNDICEYLLKTDGVINVYMHISIHLYLTTTHICI